MIEKFKSGILEYNLSITLLRRLRDNWMEFILSYFENDLMKTLLYKKIKDKYSLRESVGI